MIFIVFSFSLPFSYGQGILNAAEMFISLVDAGQFDDELVEQAAMELANPADYPEQYDPVDSEEFDFIVVGAGTAGCVVANRLSEVPEWQVLLLEAGGPVIKSMDVPLLAPTYLNTEVDWRYRSDPDEDNCLGMTDRQCSLARGKVLGGSSNLHFMLYVRGNRRDFDMWEEAGCTGWGYNDVLPYFLKSENMRVPEVLEYSPAFHCTGGYQSLENYFDNTTFHDFIGGGMEDLGYFRQPDVNGANQTGHNVMQGSLEDGRRQSSAKAFLSPVKDRENLKVSLYSLVTRVLINESTNTAIGVEFINRDNQTVRVFARKEVILCAGTINSPQILMLSGIGPQDHLTDLGIEVVADLPVGENLHDHMVFGSFVLSTNYSNPVVSLNQSFFDFLQKRGSVFSNIPNIAEISWISTLDDPNYPNCLFGQLFFAKNDSAGMNGWIVGIVGFNEEIRNQFYELNAQYDLIYTVCAYLSPYSRGRIELRSTDPRDHPKYTTGFFSDERDFDVMLPFYNFVEKLVETDDLKKINATINEIRIPECDQFTFGSSEYRRCSLKYVTGSCLHMVGTCRMGGEDSTDNVVDPRLRVKGVRNLRVIDGSIMPNVTRANTWAPCQMIGEKGAELIKMDWSKCYRPVDITSASCPRAL